MRTLGKWLAIAMGIYLAIAVVMNAVEPARREKAEQDAQAAAKLEQRQAAAAASKEKRVQECAELSDERQTIHEPSPRGQCLLHGAQYVRDKQRQIDAIRRFGADVDRSELKGKCNLARLMAPNFRFVECRDVQ